MEDPTRRPRRCQAKKGIPLGTRPRCRSRSRCDCSISERTMRWCSNRLWIADKDNRARPRNRRSHMASQSSPPASREDTPPILVSIELFWRQQRDSGRTAGCSVASWRCSSSPVCRRSCLSARLAPGPDAVLPRRHHSMPVTVASFMAGLGIGSVVGGRSPTGQASQPCGTRPSYFLLFPGSPCKRAARRATSPYPRRSWHFCASMLRECWTTTSRRSVQRRRSFGRPGGGELSVRRGNP